MLVMGSMIGSGIFIVSADMMRISVLDIGSSSVWIITGIMTVAAAFAMANFRQCFQKQVDNTLTLQKFSGKDSDFCTVGECLP